MTQPPLNSPNTTSGHSPSAHSPSPHSGSSHSGVHYSAHQSSSAQHLATVRAHYPEAITTSESVDRLLDCMATDYGIKPQQLLLADSICSDDVNAFEYPRRAFEMVGPFKLGGLNGFPHAGLTGMGAFAGHVPDEGAIIIYHAPHVGVSSDGTLGSIVRVGQNRHTGCCGAARAALNKLREGSIVEAPPSHLDYQQETIEQLFLVNRDRILGAPDGLKEATEVMYEAISERIDLLLERTQLNARWLVRFGGILVNGDADMGSFSAARRVLVTDLKTGEEECVLRCMQLPKEEA